MPSELRNQLFSCYFKPELTPGVANSNVITTGQYFGLHSALTMPDPVYSWIPLHGLSAATARPDNARSWPLIHYGKQIFEASLGNMVLVTGHALPFILGRELTSAGTHDIREGMPLPTFTMDARFYNVDRNYPDLIRRWVGCKIDVASIYVDQRGYLILGIEKLIATNMAHNVGTVAATDAQRQYFKWSPGLTANTPLDYPFSGERDPYLFSGGQVQILDGGELKTPTGFLTLRNISRFAVSVNNNLTTKYYETTSSTDDIRAPYEILEGRREYRVSVTADVMSNEYYGWLLNQGRYGAEKRGLGIRAIFTKRPGILSNNDLEIRIPGDTNANNWSNTITEISPVAGEGSSNYNIGAFALQGAHNVTEDARVRVNFDFIAPSVSFLVHDRFSSYMAVA